MSGMFDKMKDLTDKIDPDMVDKAADAIEENVSDEMVQDTLKKVPGGDKIAEQVPEDVGDKVSDAARGLLGSKDDE